LVALISNLRPEVSVEEIEKGIQKLADKLNYRLASKGRGAYASRHEILGILEEEMVEVKEAIRDDTQQGYIEFQKELLDVAVGAIFAYISMTFIQAVSNHD
jgi:ElaB/YqjD/DUF883 family membrane-anchored ribosome-binding protein